MPISWNEIRHNAVGFSRCWAWTTNETAEKQPFWNEFFQVFGLQRRPIATFEGPVRRITGQYGHIDLFWKRTLLVEHKSIGQDLGKAQSQAFQNIQDLLSPARLHQRTPARRVPLRPVRANDRPPASHRQTQTHLVQPMTTRYP